MPDFRSELPAPSADQLAHSEQAAALICHEISRSGGVVPFVRFMDLALYAPGLGYYSAGQRKFGSAGDFVTSSEVSELFGFALARQFAEALQFMGGGDIWELGAGSGAFAADTLAELARLERLPAKYYILEVSADLRDRQRQRIQEHVPDLLDRVEWLDAWPRRFNGVVFANELLDAMPVCRFLWDGELKEYGVACAQGKLSWILNVPDDALTVAVETIQASVAGKWPAGYTSEVNTGLGAWFRSLAESIERGVLFFIDYGYPRAEYYLPERSMGTLTCHYRHRVHDDPLVLVGLQDITVFVDFTAVADAGIEAGFDLCGYTTQAQFLLGCGVTDLLALRDPANHVAYAKLAQELKLLMLPGEMGDRFKVMGFQKGVEFAPRGFKLRDYRARL